MGGLYLARDTNPATDRLVAIKLLSTHVESSDMLGRFKREAQALALLSHPNIVVIHDSGEHMGAPYIVMEYVRGETLAEIIKRRAQLSLGTKLRLAIELCEGLAHAHAAGIIHRDVKPANIMVDLYGRVKLVDFGIARDTDAPGTQVPLTRVHVRIGTPGYMSPEQIMGGPIDYRTDVFAAGAVCYELLSYSKAFKGANTREIEARVLHESPPALENLMPATDSEVAAIVNRALEKDASARFQHAGALAEAFEQVRLRVAGADGPARKTPPPATDYGGNRDSRRRRAADVACSRARAAAAEGAHEFACRSAIEALAEFPGHTEAAAILRTYGAGSEVLALAPTQPQSNSVGVLVDWASGPAGIVQGNGLRSAASVNGGAPWHTRIRSLPVLILAVVVITAVIATMALRWRPPAPRDDVDSSSESVDKKSQVPAAASSLQVRVLDAGGTPVVDARIWTGKYRARHVGDGQYLFDSLPPGDHVVEVAHTGAGVPQRLRVLLADNAREVTEIRLAVEDALSVAPSTSRSGQSGTRPALTGVASGETDAANGPGQTRKDDAVTPTRSVSETARRPSTQAKEEGPIALAWVEYEKALDALVNDGDAEVAQQLLLEAMRLNPQFELAAAKLAEVRGIIAVSRRQQVRDSLRAAQQLFTVEGLIDAALEEVERALKLDPGNTDALALQKQILQVKAIDSRKRK